jgi:hypothetical protein
VLFSVVLGGSLLHIALALHSPDARCALVSSCNSRHFRKQSSPSRGRAQPRSRAIDGWKCCGGIRVSTSSSATVLHFSTTLAAPWRVCRCCAHYKGLCKHTIIFLSDTQQISDIVRCIAQTQALRKANQSRTAPATPSQSSEPTLLTGPEPKATFLLPSTNYNATGDAAELHSANRRLTVDFGITCLRNCLHLCSINESNEGTDATHLDGTRQAALINLAYLGLAACDPVLVISSTSKLFATRNVIRCYGYEAHARTHEREREREREKSVMVSDGE